MRTAEEMAQYCEDNNTGSSVSKKWRLKHFKVAEAQLRDSEEVIGCFMGLHNYKGMTSHDGNFAYAVTKDRIIATQKKVMGENVIIITRKHLNDVKKSTGMMLGMITLDTFKETINVQVDKPQANAIYGIILNTLFDEQDEDVTKGDSNEKAKSPIEELKEYKELLDLEIITQEEFDIKKKQLLN